MKTSIYLTLMFVFAGLNNRASAQVFQWAKQLGGSGNEYSSVTVLDTAGNIYTTGYFEGTADFDPGPGFYFLTSAGVDDIFISKLDASGNFLWAKRMGGSNYDWSFGLTLDAFGNVYTTGTFFGTVDFDPGPGIYNLNSPPGYDCFISKLDAAGNFIWAKQIAGTASSQGITIAFDASLNIYTTGYFSGTSDFDPGPGIFNLTSAGWSDIYVSKLDAAGNFLWAKRMGGTGQQYSWCMRLDASGNIYTLGGFQGTVDFDPGVGIFNLTAAGSDDIFISKLDINGNFLWAKKMGGTGNDNVEAVSLDALGNLYITGGFNGTADFDPGVGVFNFTSTGVSDIFISKLDPAGNFIWAKHMGGNGNDYGYSIALDSYGNIYSTGRFSGTSDFRLR